MPPRILLEHLNLSELNILLGHLRLGEGHLKSQLSEEQFRSLLQLGSLNLEQKLNVSANKIEKSGNLAVVLNTIVTSVFGAWMGFSGFSGLHLTHTALAIITCTALIISLLVGYFSFALTSANARAAVYKQKIHNVQLKVLKLIIEKQQNTLESAIKYINHSVNYIQSKSSIKNHHPLFPDDEQQLIQFNHHEEFTQSIHTLTESIQTKIEQISKDKIYHFYRERLLKIVETLNKKIMQTWFIDDDSSKLPSYSKSNLAPQLSFIQIISSQNATNYTPEPIHKNWFQQNLLALVAGSIPTLLGGFASMFVFLTGGPNVAKELGWTYLEYSLRNPHSQAIEFCLAILLTFYFGASFAYSNYKNYMRQREIEKSLHQLVSLEKTDVYLKRKYTLLSKIKTEIKRIINIYTAIDNIEEYHRDARSSLVTLNDSSITPEKNKELTEPL